jgi:hypothetical protein
MQSRERCDELSRGQRNSSHRQNANHSIWTRGDYATVCMFKGPATLFSNKLVLVMCV